MLFTFVKRIFPGKSNFYYCTFGKLLRSHPSYNNFSMASASSSISFARHNFNLLGPWVTKLMTPREGEALIDYKLKYILEKFMDQCRERKRFNVFEDFTNLYKSLDEIYESLKFEEEDEEDTINTADIPCSDCDEKKQQISELQSVQEKMRDAVKGQQNLLESYKAYMEKIIPKLISECIEIRHPDTKEYLLSLMNIFRKDHQHVFIEHSSKIMNMIEISKHILLDESIAKYDDAIDELKFKHEQELLEMHNQITSLKNQLDEAEHKRLEQELQNIKPITDTIEVQTPPEMLTEFDQLEKKTKKYKQYIKFLKTNNEKLKKTVDTIQVDQQFNLTETVCNINKEIESGNLMVLLKARNGAYLRQITQNIQKANMEQIGDGI